MIINTYEIHIEKLNTEYRDVFMKIKKYVTASNMDEMQTEETLSEVMDTFLSAQESGKPVEKVVGKDLQKFCENLCSERGIGTHIMNFIEVIDSGFKVIFFMCIFDFFSLPKNLESFDFFTLQSRTSLLPFFGGWMLFMILTYISNHFKRKNMFKHSKLVKLTSVITVILIFVGAIAVFSHFDEKAPDGTYLWVMLLVSVIGMIITHILTKKKRQFKKDNKIRFSEFLDMPSVTEDIEKIEMKRFEKINKKRVKKGQPEMSFEEFLDSEDKRFNKWDKKAPFHIALAVGCTLLSTIVIRLFNGFETTSDMFYFFFILFGVESIVMYGLFKFTDYGSKTHLKWIESKRK